MHYTAVDIAEESVGTAVGIRRQLGGPHREHMAPAAVDAGAGEYGSVTLSGAIVEIAVAPNVWASFDEQTFVSLAPGTTRALTTTAVARSVRVRAVHASPTATTCSGYLLAAST